MTSQECIQSLSQYMLERNLNQEEIAKKLNVTAVAIGHWFKGETGVSFRNRQRIEKLIKGTVAPPPPLPNDTEQMFRDAQKIVALINGWGDQCKYVLEFAQILINVQR